MHHTTPSCTDNPLYIDLICGAIYRVRKTLQGIIHAVGRGGYELNHCRSVPW
jgi:hypothetical protein